MANVNSAPDALSILLSNLPRGPQIPLVAAPPMGSLEDLQNRAAQPRQPIQVTDDDADLNSARSAMQRTQGQVNDQIQRQLDVQNKIAAVPPVDPRQYKPSWKDRLLGGVVGAAAEFGNEGTGRKAAMDFTNRKYSRAVAARNRQLEPLFTQLEAGKQNLPLFKEANEGAWRTYESARNERTDARLQQATDAKAQYERDMADIRESMASNRHDEALKKIKDAEDKLKQQGEYQQKLLDLKQQILDAKGNDKSATKAQFATVGNRKAQALATAEKEYQRKIAKLDPSDVEGHKQAEQELEDAKQASQNAYEEGVTTLGGSADHFEYGQKPPATAQQAPPQPTDDTPPASIWKNRENKVLTFQNGQKWQLVKGIPQRVK